MTDQPTPAAQQPARIQPESLRLRTLSAGLTVGDLEASIAWYRDVVGFTVTETWEREGKMVGASLIAGTESVVLSQDDWAKGRDRVKGEGFRLYFGTAQDVDEIAEGIKARGGTLESEPQDMPWGTRAFGLVDPDGFKLTISAES